MNVSRFGLRATAFVAVILVASVRSRGEVPLPPAAPPKFEEPRANKTYIVPAGAILRFSLEGPLHLSHLRPGSGLDGKLLRPTYSVDREVIPAESRIHLVIDSVKKTKETKKGFVERLDSLRKLGLDRKTDYSIKFRSATIMSPGGAVTPMQVEFIQAGEVVRLHSKGDEIQVGDSSLAAKAKSMGPMGKVAELKRRKAELQLYRHPVMSVELREPLNVSLPVNPNISAGAALAQPSGSSVEIPAGTHARLLLLNRLSSSTNHQGDTFEARLLEPIVRSGLVTVPEGAIFEGHVRRLLRPRRLSRAGSLHLVFDKFTVAGEPSKKIAASLAATDLDKKASADMDSEGGLRGKGRGARKLVSDLGLALAMNHVVDEAIEMSAHAAGPWVSVPTGLLVFLGGHGQDVSLPKYSELEVVFNRSVMLSAQP